MHIIIPMSGQGSRFAKAGYTVPKPLIEVDGKPIIAHVIDLFPGEKNFTFICNAAHLNNPDYQMAEILKKYCPTGRIIEASDSAAGPVAAILPYIDSIKDNEPVVVNYCDFACYWDWNDFKKTVSASGCDGAIPAYRGFHPHSLGSTYYAYMQTTGDRVTAIQEKQPYTDNPMEEFASSGTYYFASGALMKSAFKAQVEKALLTNGEYYVSLAYQPLLEAGKKIQVYPLQHFMQWGTPEDLEEYNHWSRVFKLLAKKQKRAKQAGMVCIPMAGFGSRFKIEGFSAPKPLLPVSGKPMVIQALADLPEAPRTRLVLREESAALAKQPIPGVEYHFLTTPTEGQACTVLAAIEDLPEDMPITVGSCDNGALYDSEKFEQMMKDPAIDVIVWGARGHFAAKRCPTHYGWIDVDPQGVIDKVSVKVPLKKPERDPIITGCFTFKRVGDLKAAIGRLLANETKVKGEYYLDSAVNDAIALGLRCHLFEVDAYLGWGTPVEWKTFNYWQSCFHLWSTHPYRLEKDDDVAPESQQSLDAQVQRWEEASLVD